MVKPNTQKQRKAIPRAHKKARPLFAAVFKVSRLVLRRLRIATVPAETAYRSPNLVANRMDTTAAKAIFKLLKSICLFIILFSHADSCYDNYGNSLANALAWYFAKQNKPFIFRCVNRLDKDTSGLTIIAKHMVSAGILSTMVAAKGTDTPPSGTQCPTPILREYLAIVRGKVNPEAGTINAPIARKEGSVLERTVDFVKGENAITHYRTVSTKNGYSLLSITLETGRTHQIRVHMKYLGYPLIGDYLYNPDTELISRQALHSHRLSFVHPITHKPMDFTAPLPPDMQFVL